MKHVFAGTIVAVTLAAFQTQAAEKKAGGMDANSDGKVSCEEFCAAREKAAEKKGAEFKKAAAEKQFAAKDKNKDGFLTGEELQHKPKAKEAPKAKDEGSDEE